VNTIQCYNTFFFVTHYEDKLAIGFILGKPFLASFILERNPRGSLYWSTIRYTIL